MSASRRLVASSSRSLACVASRRLHPAKEGARAPGGTLSPPAAVYPLPGTTPGTRAGTRARRRRCTTPFRTGATRATRGVPRTRPDALDGRGERRPVSASRSNAGELPRATKSAETTSRRLGRGRAAAAPRRRRVRRARRPLPPRHRWPLPHPASPSLLLRVPPRDTSIASSSRIHCRSHGWYSEVLVSSLSMRAPVVSREFIGALSQRATSLLMPSPSLHSSPARSPPSPPLPSPPHAPPHSTRQQPRLVCLWYPIGVGREQRSGRGSAAATHSSERRTIVRKQPRVQI